MNKYLAMIPLLLFCTILHAKYTIKEFNYDIKGSTNPFFLELRLGIDKSRTFETLEEIEEYRIQLNQDIYNLRVFEKQNISTLVEDNQVSFIIELKDAWNILFIPYPKYSSQKGGRIAARVHWNNTLGTLTNSLFVGGIIIGLNSKNQLQLREWDATVMAQGVTIYNRFYNFSLSQNLTMIPKDDDEWRFYRTQIGVSTIFGPFWGQSYGAGLSLGSNYGYEIYEGLLTLDDIPKSPLDLTYSHNIGKSNINWVGNFRDGYSYSVGNSISLIWGEQIKPTTSLSGTVSYFKPLGELPLAIGHKLFGVISFNNELLGLGSNLRGVKEGHVYGNMGLFLNNNLYVRTIKIKGFAEAIFAPYFDIGLSDSSGIKYGSGADFILYVDKLKSLVARGTLGWDLTEGFKAEEFDISITSSLFF